MTAVIDVQVRRLVSRVHDGPLHLKLLALCSFQFEETLPNMCNFVTVFQRKLRDPKGVAVGPAQEDME